MAGIEDETFTTAAQLQALVMSMADDYAVGLDLLSAELKRASSTPTERIFAHNLGRDGMAAAFDIGASPNPGVALLDMLVLVSLERAVFDRYWLPEIWGDRGANVAVQLARSEERAWHKASVVLDERQQEVLRGLIDAWLKRYEDYTSVAFIRFVDFTDERTLPRRNDAARGLLREVNDAREAIDELRFLGERALWLASRIPYNLGQLVELTAYELAAQPETQAIMSSLDSLRDSAERLTAAAEHLPEDARQLRIEFADTLATQREATIDDLTEAIAMERRRTIDHFMRELRAERIAMLNDIEAREAPLRDVLIEMRTTLAASTDLATALEETAQSVDQVLARFDRAPHETRKPLDMKDVGDAAIETTKAAQQLTELLNATATLLESPRWDERLRSVDTNMTGLVDRISLRVFATVGLFVLGLLAHAWYVARLRRKAA